MKIGDRVQFVDHMRSRFSARRREREAIGTVYGMVNWSNGNPADPKQRRYALVKWDVPVPPMWADTPPAHFMWIATRCLEPPIRDQIAADALACMAYAMTSLINADVPVATSRAANNGALKPYQIDRTLAFFKSWRMDHR